MDKPSNKIKIKTPSKLAKASRNKWIVILGLSLVAVIVITSSLGGNQVRTALSNKDEELIDVSPGDIGKHLSEKLQTNIVEDKKQIKSLKQQVTTLEFSTAEAHKENKSLESQLKQIMQELTTQQKTLDSLKNSNSTIKTSGDKGKVNGYKLLPVAPKDNSSNKRNPLAPPPPLQGEPYKANKFEVNGDSYNENSNRQDVASVDQPMIFHAKKSKSTKKNTKKKKYKKNPYAGAIPPGSFAEVALISGLDAGASELTRSEPQPVFMRIQNNATLPGNAGYRMKSCFVMGVGYGDTSSERAYIQSTKISCVDTRLGAMVVADLHGVIVDSDGTLGLRGKVERRAGALLGKAMLAGFAEGAAQIVSAAQNTLITAETGVVNTFIDPENLAKAGAYQGLSNSAKILAEQYIKEARNMFPIVAIPSGRKATLMVRDLTQLKWHPYEDQYIEEPIVPGVG